MIRSFKNRAPKRFWERNDPSKLPPAHAGRIGRILDLLDTAAVPQEMDAPGLRFHALTGNLAGRHAVTVRANWSITFAWDGQDAIEVDYEDYH